MTYQVGVPLYMRPKIENPDDSTRAVVISTVLFAGIAASVTAGYYASHMRELMKISKPPPATSPVQPDAPAESCEGATEEGMSTLDAELEACYSECSYMQCIRISAFIAQNPNPDAATIQNFVNTMPATIQKRITTMAKLLSKNPEEMIRLKALAEEKLGIHTGTVYLPKVKEAATEYLAMNGVSVVDNAMDGIDAK